MKKLILVGVVVLATLFSSWTDVKSFKREDNLSSYGFFVGKLADLKPAPGVYQYELNTPLFSNYAEKLRFVKFPESTQAKYNDTAVFDLPVGTILIKNFYYLSDFRKPEKGRRILETRLLVHEDEGWQAYPYIWNDEQTEAVYDPAGETRNVTYVNQSGKKISTPYVIPNKNQCKGCHIRNSKMVPIGPTARQLNREVSFTAKSENQLAYWQTLNLLDKMDLSNAPTLAKWDNESAMLNDRARAYLDANCGHCHSKGGPASTSGLFLDIHEQDLNRLGVNKAPVAAGRGTGELKFDIIPGDPDHSILVYRMKTNDPGIAMPEIGREQIHKEGVALIEEWIRKNTFASHD
ncbi:MAG TPA: SO2930 family diheme c-type cytochrome [Chryseosolibacter sp.]